MLKRQDNDFVDFDFDTNMIAFPELLQSYHQVFNQVVGTDGQEIEMKDKRYVWGYSLSFL